MNWRIQPLRVSAKHTSEVMQQAIQLAMTEALKQSTDMQDLEDGEIAQLGKKWEVHIGSLRRGLSERYGDHLDDLLTLAWRAHRFACHYEAALVNAELDKSDEAPPTVTARDIDAYHHFGVLVAQHYSTFAHQAETLKDLALATPPDTGEVLRALSADCFMHAALQWRENLQKALDFLADAVSAQELALQGSLQVNNYYLRKAEKARNGKAGGEKRHAKMGELRKWTIEQHKLGTWRSANHAANELMDRVLKRSGELGANLTRSNAQRTIADWIRKSV